MITDLETWILDGADRIYRYWVYKKVWTPYEQEKKFSDESEYDDPVCSFGRIVEAIELGDGDVLLGITNVYGDEGDDDDLMIDYYRLSDIHLAYYEPDGTEM